jgi:hypothetical protein
MPPLVRYRAFALGVVCAGRALCAGLEPIDDLLEPDGAGNVGRDYCDGAGYGYFRMYCWSVFRPPQVRSPLRGAQRQHRRFAPPSRVSDPVCLRCLARREGLVHPHADSGRCKRTE